MAPHNPALSSERPAPDAESPPLGVVTRRPDPILADQDRKVAELYDMVDQTNVEEGLPLTVRSVFVVDPAKRVRLMITYPASTGRNFDEIIRVVDSLQLTDNHKVRRCSPRLSLRLTPRATAQVATPVNWKDGDDCVIVPSLSNEEAESLFPQGWKELRPYLRMTPQPKK